MSIGTIVIIVLAMTMLILGMVFVRTVMCSGIMLTEEITRNVENEIRDLFGTDEYGVKCMGEEGQEIILGDGGRRQIACVITTDVEETYDLRFAVESLKGESTPEVQSWVLDSGWSGTVKPGSKTVVVAVLDVPRQVSDTNMKVTVTEFGGEPHVGYIDVKHVGTLRSAIC